MRTVAVRSLAFAVAAFGTAVAAAQTAPNPAGPKLAAPAPAAANPAPAQSGGPAATVPFDRQSVEIDASGRNALDTLAQALIAQGVRQVDLHAYATGDDTDEARKRALVRALSVRIYLIDQGVTARIEVEAQAVPARGGPKGSQERVDVMTQ
jgi:outer membrane protein OmpA-like peptidoglycan-associated protein